MRQLRPGHSLKLDDVPHSARLRLSRLLGALNPDPDSGCQLWQGYRDGKGYGQVSVGGKPHWAHRVMYALFNGPIPAGETVHHTCGEPSCVNPDHLELLSRAANTAEGNRRRAS